MSSHSSISYTILHMYNMTPLLAEKKIYTHNESRIKIVCVCNLIYRVKDIFYIFIYIKLLGFYNCVGKQIWKTF